ncbi:hypothetical protein HK104_002548 [Borealophlyctis nickersoniae]|nr:hypothetical protein HK104_002548 [Borealophlyctis nickersoniae]
MSPTCDTCEDLRTRCTALQTEQETVHRNAQKLKSFVGSIHDGLASLSTDAEERRRERAELDELRREKADAERRREVAVEEMRREKAVVEEKLAKEEEKVRAAKKEVVTQRGRVQQVERQVAQLRNELENTKRELELCRKSLVAAKRVPSQETNTARISELESENARLAKELQTTKQSLEKDLALARGRISTFEKAKDQAHQRQADLQNQNTELKKQIEGLKSAERAKDQAHQREAELQKRNTALKKQIEELKSEERAKDQREAELQKRNTALKKQIEELKSEERAKDQANHREAELQKRNMALTKQVEELRNQIEENSRVWKRKEREMHDQIKELSEVKNQLKEDMAILRKEKTPLLDMYERQKKEIDELKRENVELKQRSESRSVAGSPIRNVLPNISEVDTFASDGALPVRRSPATVRSSQMTPKKSSTPEKSPQASVSTKAGPSRSGSTSRGPSPHSQLSPRLPSLSESPSNVPEEPKLKKRGRPPGSKDSYKPRKIRQVEVQPQTPETTPPRHVNEASDVRIVRSTERTTARSSASTASRAMDKPAVDKPAMDKPTAVGGSKPAQPRKPASNPVRKAKDAVVEAPSTTRAPRTRIDDLIFLKQVLTNLDMDDRAAVASLEADPNMSSALQLDIVKPTLETTWLALDTPEVVEEAAAGASRRRTYPAGYELKVSDRLPAKERHIVLFLWVWGVREHKTNFLGEVLAWIHHKLTTTRLEKSGLALACRMARAHTSLCRFANDLQRSRVLCYDILREVNKGGEALVVLREIGKCWPDVFENVPEGHRDATYLAIELVLGHGDEAEFEEGQLPPLHQYVEKRLEELLAKGTSDEPDFSSCKALELGFRYLDWSDCFARLKTMWRSIESPDAYQPALTFIEGALRRSLCEREPKEGSDFLRSQLSRLLKSQKSEPLPYQIRLAQALLNISRSKQHVKVVRDWIHGMSPEERGKVPESIVRDVEIALGQTRVL